jgi:beta-1,4-mannosyltransferase
MTASINSIDGSASVRSVVAWPATAELNPYTGLLYAEMRKSGIEVLDFMPKMGCTPKADIIHVHWPEQIFWRGRSRASLVADAGRVIRDLRRFKAAGAKMVLTAHNDRPHELGRFSRVLWRFYSAAFYPLVDGTIFLGSGSRDTFLAAWPSLAARPQAVIPHGHYRGAYRQREDRSVARRRLGLPPDAPVALFFGLIRRYKNVPALMRAFREVEAPTPVLLVAGECLDPALRAEVEAGAAADPRIRLFLNYVPADHVPGFFAAADLAVMPFSRITNSGSALLALSFDLPIVIPEMLSLDEVRAETGPAWVYRYSGTISGEILTDALAWAKSPRPATAPLDAFDWPILARQTVGFYSRLKRGVA